MHEKAEKLPAGAGSGGMQKMPYKGKPGDKNPIIDMKRKELAKKKAQIISGQNTQTAAAAKKSGATMLGPIVI
jgi:hypothetical protein